MAWENGRLWARMETSLRIQETYQGLDILLEEKAKRQRLATTETYQDSRRNGSFTVGLESSQTPSSFRHESRDSF